MSDPPPYREPGTGPDSGSPAGTPRWVKVFGALALVVVLLLVVLLLAGGGHGPGRHATDGAAPGWRQP